MRKRITPRPEGRDLRIRVTPTHSPTPQRNRENERQNTKRYYTLRTRRTLLLHLSVVRMILMYAFVTIQSYGMTHTISPSMTHTIRPSMAHTIGTRNVIH